MKIFLALIVALTFICGTSLDASAKGHTRSTERHVSHSDFHDSHLRSECDLRTNAGVGHFFQHVAMEGN